MAVRYFFSHDGQSYLGGYEGEGALALVPENAIEVQSPPPHGLDKLNPETLEIIPYEEPISALKQLTTIFKELSAEQQAQFGSFAAQVFLFLSQDNPDAAKFVIQGAVVPPEFEALKAQMLAVFPA